MCEKFEEHFFQLTRFILFKKNTTKIMIKSAAKKYMLLICIIHRIFNFYWNSTFQVLKQLNQSQSRESQIKVCLNKSNHLRLIVSCPQGSKVIGQGQGREYGGSYALLLSTGFQTTQNSDYPLYTKHLFLKFYQHFLLKKRLNYCLYRSCQDILFC